MKLLVIFLGGWLGGMLAEYTYHWYMHHKPLMFHIRHHREFFHLSPPEIARNSRNLNFDFRYAALLLISLSPLTFFWGWQPILFFWIGAFWHLVILYESSHSIIHDDSWIPRFIVRSSLYKWWKGCHFVHHQHSPTGNYCVTFPLLDWFLGTYVHPGPLTVKTPDSDRPPVHPV